MNENANESTPSLIGASVRSVQDQELASTSSSRSPSKSNRKTGDSYHDDYTSVNDLVDEGALIHDEQAYDDLLDETGKVRPSVSHTSIPGTESSPAKSKQPSRKPPARSKEITIDDLEDEPSSKTEPIVSPLDPPSVSGSDHSHSIYELKNGENNDMSLEDLIDSQIASMSELSTNFQKRISEKKANPKVLEASRSRSRKRSNSGTVPDSVIENDSLQQVPAGAREGVYSPLIQSRSQSRSQSAIRSEKNIHTGDRPHLAGGESYKGVHTEYRPGRKAQREDVYTHITHSSKEYLRSVSRSRSRAATDKPKSNEELYEEGALLHDPEHGHDLDVARDEAIDHLHDDVLQEESDEDEIKTSEKTQKKKSISDEEPESSKEVNAVEEEISKPVETKEISEKEAEEKSKEVVETEEGADIAVPKNLPAIADIKVSESAEDSTVSKDEEKTEEVKEVFDNKETEDEPVDVSKESSILREEPSTKFSTEASSSEEKPVEEEEIISPKVSDTKEPVTSSVCNDVDLEENKDPVETQSGTTVEVPKDLEDVADVKKTNDAKEETKEDAKITEPIEAIDEKTTEKESKVAKEEDEKESEPIEAEETVATPVQDKQEDLVEKLDEKINKGDVSLEKDVDTPLVAEDDAEETTAEEDDTAVDNKEVSTVDDSKEPQDVVLGKKETEDSSIEAATEGVKTLKVDDESEETTTPEAEDDGESKDAEEKEPPSKVADPAGEAERLIKELEEAIDGDDTSVKEPEAEELADDVQEKEVTADKAPETKAEADVKAKELGHIAAKDKGDSEINIVKDEPKEETNSKEIEAESEPTATTVAEEEEDLDHEPTKEEIIEMLKDEPVYLYTSLAGGGYHMPQRTNRLVTILQGNRIPFTYRDLGTDEEARNVWRRYSRGRLLPAIVRGKDDIIGNFQEIEEANEDYRVRELIYETL